MDTEFKAAGRELDCAIAERVMGFKKGNQRGRCDCGFDPHLKNYSTEISAVWEVVEKMKSIGWEIILDNMSCGWQAHFEKDLINFNVIEIETAPHAICLAALEAIGDKV